MEKDWCIKLNSLHVKRLTTKEFAPWLVPSRDAQIKEHIATCNHPECRSLRTK